MKKTTIAAVILGVLVVISLVQAFQLNNLKTSVAEGDVSVSSASSSTPTAASTGTGDSGRTSELPSSIKDLPKMVGGC